MEHWIDTNVLAFDTADTHKKQVAQRLVDALMHQDRLRLNTQVLQELFVTLTRKASRSFLAKALDDRRISRDPGGHWPCR